ncbi:MAG: anti-sigma factor family protein [Candidatus Saccharibacteria bacterium]
MRARCPDEGLIQAYADGEIDDLQKKKIDAHLLTCEHCAKLIEQVSSMDAWLCKAFAADSCEIIQGRLSVARIKNRWMLLTVLIVLAATIGSWIYSASLLNPYSHLLVWWGNGLQWVAVSEVANSLWAFIINSVIDTFSNNNPIVVLVQVMSQWSLMISLICIYLIFRISLIKSKRIFIN